MRSRARTLAHMDGDEHILRKTFSTVCVEILMDKYKWHIGYILTCYNSNIISCLTMIILNRLHPHTTATAADDGVPTARICVLARVIESDAARRSAPANIRCSGTATCRAVKLSTVGSLAVSWLSSLRVKRIRARHGHATHDCC